jgi:hypothetical protein
MLEAPVLNADGSHVVCIVGQAGMGKAVVLLDGKPVYETTLSPLSSIRTVSQPGFTPDGESIVIPAWDGLHVRGNTTADYPGVSQYGIAFSPDGQLAYATHTAPLTFHRDNSGTSQVFVGSTAYPPVKGLVDDITFSPQGDLLYVSHWNTSTPGEGIDRAVPYVNGVAGPTYDSLLSAACDDTRKFWFDAPNQYRYVAIKDGVVEGVEGVIPAREGGLPARMGDGSGSG